MGMEHITGTAYGLVMRQGIEAGRAGNTGRHGMIAQPVGAGAAGKRAGTEAPAKSNREEMRQNRPGGMVGFVPSWVHAWSHQPRARGVRVSRHSFPFPLAALLPGGR